MPSRKPLLAAATRPYRATGFINHQWARGKLGHDPIFAALLEHQVFPDNASVIDLGCGRGLLAAWLLAAERLFQDGQWSGAAPPQGLRFRGVELMAREADCGNRALQPLYGERVRLQGGDMRDADLSDANVIAMLDVLHYIPYADQEALLDKIRAALGSGGVFITRVGDAGSGWRFAISQWVDMGIMSIQGHRLSRLWCRPLAEWIKALETRGFTVQAVPMSEGTPFANVMLVARIP
ncbi:MAG: class I SAM-dependent methyltransferase [Azonexus sp.]|jgi:SAM-dependent methyltransferase|nr:class I SAM-dependent methyltransferase [Azonexus sp.]